jgi:hypothetical protein
MFWKSSERRSVVLVAISVTIFFNVLSFGKGATPLPANIVPIFMAGPVSDNPARATPDQNRGNPVDTHTKTKAGFLAGAGLLILSLLGLGTALALVRAFRR